MKTAQEHEQTAREAREQSGSANGTNGDKPRFKPGHSLIWISNQPIDHTQTLLGNRYLCRGGGMFVIAPSGMGKSSLSIQIAMLWACGLIAFKIRPSKALRILIVQSEDDQGDCTEMTAMKDHLNLTEKQKQQADENTELIRCNDLVADRFIEALRARLQQARDDGKPFDLVIINPYGVYLGADVKDVDACTKFLNEWLNPLLTEFEIGAILIHHTAKTNFQNTEKYSIWDWAWDWAYHGAGAACITNWARAILAIKPETEDMTVFKFIAAKRGKRIRDEWENSFEQYFCWSTLPDVMRWEDATADQINKATAAKSKAKFADVDQVCQCVPLVDPELKATVENKVRQNCGLSRDDARSALNELCVTGRIFTRNIPNPKPKSRGFAAWCQTAGSEDTNGSEDTAAASPEQTAAGGQSDPPDQEVSGGKEVSGGDQPSGEQPSPGHAASQGQAAGPDQAAPSTPTAGPEPSAFPERPSPEATASQGQAAVLGMDTAPSRPVSGPEIPPSPGLKQSSRSVFPETLC